MTITFRLEQGYALSYAQVDENFRSVQELTGLAQQFAIDAQEASDIAAQARDDAIDAKDEAALIVANAATHLGNIASVDPAPSKVPLAGSEGTIKQAWVDSLEFELDALRVAKNKALYGDGPYPVLDLQFQGAKYLDPRITFTRATPDWDWNGKRYEANEPILSNEGLWLWGSRTNLIPNTDCMTMIRLSGMTLQPFHGDRNLSATMIKGSSSTTISSAYYPNIANDQNTLRCYSIYIKAGKDYTENVSVQIRTKIDGSQGAVFLRIAFNGELIPATVGDTLIHDYGRDYIGDGVYRFWLSASAPGESLIEPHFYVRIPSYFDSDSEIVHIGNPQVEYGVTRPTPVIPTNGSQVTVAASTLEVLADSFSDKFNPNEGTIVWRVGRNHYSSAADTTPHANMGIVGSGANNGLLAISGNNLVYHDSNGDYQESLAVPAQPFSNDEFTIAYTYTKTGVSVSHNGELATAEWDVSEFLENAVNRLYVSGLTNGYVRSLSYYDRALSDEQLQELTK